MILEPRCRLILASASPRRRELLTQAGLPHEVVVSDVDESALRLPEGPVRHAVDLAMAKARDVASRGGTGCFIGADTVVSVDEHILGKPVDADDALRMLRLLQGRTHQVVTGVAVLRAEDGRIVSERSAHCVTDVRMRPATDDELRRYIESGEPMDKAGAYGIQGRAALFIEGIRGDYFNVVGLPLFTLAGLLRETGCL